MLGVEELRGLKGFQYTATLLDLERLRFVGTCCLRLLRVYICEIYPISGMIVNSTDKAQKIHKSKVVGKLLTRTCTNDAFIMTVLRISHVITPDASMLFKLNQQLIDLIRSEQQNAILREQYR